MFFCSFSLDRAHGCKGKSNYNFHIIDVMAGRLEIQRSNRVRVVAASILEVNFLFYVAEVFTKMSIELS